jgi:hypothetical protein
VWGTRASLAEWLLASAPSWLERLEAHSGRNQLANGSLTNKTWDPTDLRSILVGFRLGELSSTMHFFQSPPKVETSRREIPKHSGSKTEKKNYFPLSTPKIASWWYFMDKSPISRPRQRYRRSFHRRAWVLSLKKALKQRAMPETSGLLRSGDKQRFEWGQHSQNQPKFWL